MSKHAGSPYRDLLSSRLDLWKSRGFKGGWNGLAKAEMKIQVQSYHVPKQKKEPPRNPPQSPKCRAFPFARGARGAAGFHVEHVTVSGAGHLAGSMIRCGDSPSTSNVPHVFVTWVFSCFIRILFLLAPEMETDLYY